MLSVSRQSGMERFVWEVKVLDQIVSGVESGLVQSVYGTHPYQIDIEVLDLDCVDPDAGIHARLKLREVEENLYKID